MEGKFAFARPKARQRFFYSGLQIICCDVAENVKTSRVGMPGQMIFRVFSRKDVNGGMLEGMIAAGFEDEGKVEDHGVIILPPSAFGSLPHFTLHLNLPQKSRHD